MDMLKKIEKVSEKAIRFFDGQTAARSHTEALAVAYVASKVTGEHYVVVSGPKAWDTGKPLCYLIVKHDG